MHGLTNLKIYFLLLVLVQIYDMLRFAISSEPGGDVV